MENRLIPISIFMIKSEIHIGDIVKFGRYPFWENGRKEQIEWQVLAKKNDMILVISRYALDAKPYNENLTDVAWESCSLRKWLNGEFLESAFTAEEIEQIIYTHVSAEKNTYYGDADYGNDTFDKAFLLSAGELSLYFNEEVSTVLPVTPYARKNNVYTWWKGCWWWLRSPGRSCNNAAIINYEGSINYYGDYVDDAGNAVRPAMWLKIKNQ